MLTSSDIARLPVRERVGLAIQAADAATTISRIREAEQAGIQQVWMTQSMGMLDTLTLFMLTVQQGDLFSASKHVAPVLEWSLKESRRSRNGLVESEREIGH